MELGEAFIGSAFRQYKMDLSRSGNDFDRHYGNRELSANLWDETKYHLIK